MFVFMVLISIFRLDLDYRSAINSSSLTNLDKVISVLEITSFCNNVIFFSVTDKEATD